MLLDYVLAGQLDHTARHLAAEPPGYLTALLGHPTQPTAPATNSWPADRPPATSAPSCSHSASPSSPSAIHSHRRAPRGGSNSCPHNTPTC